jgi:hypothetical protein
MRRILFTLNFFFYMIAARAQVGVGTSSPGMQLHVSNADSAVALFENRQTLDAGISNSLYFKTGSGSFPFTGAIKTIGGSTSTARLGLFTYASVNPNNLQERLSVTDAGMVGIGVTSPLTMLHVAGPGADLGLFENTQNLGANVTASLYFKMGNGSFPYTGAIKSIGQTTAEARLGFFTYASPGWSGLKERLSILDNGNVGIGFTSPAAGLSVARGTGADGTAAFFGTNYTSHFNYSTTENTYIRGGKITSAVLINDNNFGDVQVGSGSARVSVFGGIMMNIRHADFFSSSYVYVYDNDYTLVVDFSNSGYLGRQIILPYPTGRAGQIYNIVAVNLPGGSYIPANIVEGVVGGTYIGYINSAQLTETFQSDGYNWIVISRGKGA